MGKLFLQRNHYLMIIILVSIITGIAIDRLWLLRSNHQNTQTDEKQPLYWVAPMDPNFKRDKPGKSPMGMDLVPVYSEGNLDDTQGVVNINPYVENNLGVRTTEVNFQNLELKINTVGFITFDEKQLTHFHSRVEGWIERLAVTAVGDSIKKGQKLFELYSPELVYAQQEFLSSIKSSVPALQESAQGKLKSWGISDKQINQLRKRGKVRQRLEYNSEQDGYIANLNVREGMFIKPATTILSIGNLDTIWVIAEIFERQADWVKPGQIVHMKVDSHANRHWEGKVDYVYPILDAKTRTLQARIIFDNPEHRLKPNMFARLSIHSKPGEQTLAIPREALIRDGRMDRVVQSLGDGRYKSIQVQTGIETEDTVEILAGLKAGDKIVTSAHFLIDSESNISADLNRIENSQNHDTENHHDMKAHHHD